jgi:hypothetical protein
VSVRLLVVVAALLLLTGCASPNAPLFQAAWFLASVESGEASTDAKSEAPSAAADAGVRPAVDRLYIGVLNQSDEHHTVSAIVINGSPPAGEDGWRLDGEFPLAPGQMLVRPAASFRKDHKAFPVACHLPVSVLVVFAPDQRSARAEIRGRMPNFLPAEWDRACAR